MTDIWSLVFFTVLAQCAAGLSIFIALDRYATQVEGVSWPARVIWQTWVAIVILCIGTLFSLLHLSSPLISFYSITHLATSWLSREILFAGLFGACLLFGVLFKIAALRYVAPVVGLAFVYVMSQVYRIPNQPFWNVWMTPASFFATALLLGAALKYFLDSLDTRRNFADMRVVVLGWLPPVIGLAAAFRLVVLVYQANMPDFRQVAEMAAHGGLLALAVGFGLPLLVGGAARGTYEPEPAFPLVDSPRSRYLLAGAGLVFFILLAAEISGRAAFYRSYTWFGM